RVVLEAVRGGAHELHVEPALAQVDVGGAGLEEPVTARASHFGLERVLCGPDHVLCLAALEPGPAELLNDFVEGAHAAPRCPGTRRTANRPTRRATTVSSPNNRRTSGISTSTCAVSIPAVSSTCSTAASNSPSRAGRVTTSASSSSAAITSSPAFGSAQCCTSCTSVSVRIWSTRSTPASWSPRVSKERGGLEEWVV